MNQAAKELETPEIETGPEMTDLESDLNDVINRLEAETEEDDGLQVEKQVEAEAKEEVEEVTAQPKGEKPQQTEQTAQQPKVSPPVDWDAKEFASLPENVQQRIHQREVQISQMLQHTAQQRKLADSFMKTVEPYRQLMHQEGVRDPLQAVQGLMATTAILAMGPQEAKAHKVAELVKHYKIDIEMLDKALAGEAGPPPGPTPFEQQLMQRMAQIDQRFQMQEQAKQQAMYGQANQNIQQFAADPKNKYFPQVRLIMADFLDLATKNGQRMSLQEAYNRACAAHPEVAKMITQARAQQGAPNAAGKRRAASSVRGTAGTNPEPESTEGMEIRDILERQIPGGDSRL